MGLYADTINSVYDELKAKLVGGQPLDFISGILLGEQDQQLTLKLPHLLVMLPDPFTEEIWAALKDKRETLFRVQILVAVEAPSDKERPYGLSGDPTKRGILTVTEDVMNQIELSRTAILASSPKNIDMNLNAGQGQNIGGQDYGTTIMLRFKQRFFHGDR